MPSLSQSMAPFKTAHAYLDADLTDFRNFADLRQKKHNHRELLRWLWDECVNLIFKKLDELVPETGKLRVWWLGIGIASMFPFHAAGIYTGKVRESALSRAISSYTPSLKFLMHSRKVKIDSSSANVGRSARKAGLLIVTMPTTPGMRDLKGTEKEAEKVEEITGSTFSVQHRIQPNAEQVMEHMKDCEIVHFACHGESTSWNPLRSHLALQTTDVDSDDPILDRLSVTDVAGLSLSHGKLVFLSACSSAESRNMAWLDEALHLVAGFWVAGYLHTVGNLWPTEDDVSVEVAEGFYRDLVEAGEFGNGEHVAEALNAALLSVSARRRGQPLAWAQLVHFGI